MVLGFAAIVAASRGGGTDVFTQYGWLVDIANPIAAATAVLPITLGATLSETRTPRRLLRRELAQTREAQARLQGEPDAVRCIQRGMLPDASAARESRYAIAARMLPAREVGGDLHGFFPVGTDRLFSQVGDPSGRGLPSALFMALAKARVRGAALRADRDPGVALTKANLALNWDNPELLSLTMSAAKLTLKTAALRWSNPGHDSLAVVAAEQDRRRVSGLRPTPLRARRLLYPSEHAVLPRDAFLCLVADGVTKAGDCDGPLFGNARAEAALLAAPAAADAERVVSDLVASVQRFASGTAQALVTTILCQPRRTPA